MVKKACSGLSASLFIPPYTCWNYELLKSKIYILIFRWGILFKWWRLRTYYLLNISAPSLDAGQLCHPSETRYLQNEPLIQGDNPCVTTNHHLRFRKHFRSHIHTWCYRSGILVLSSHTHTCTSPGPRHPSNACPGIRNDQLRNEPAHEIMALFVLRKLILQTCMRRHQVGPDVQARLSLCWSPMWYHNFMGWLKWFSFPLKVFF